MYAAYFHLRARPFSATPDSSCFYASETIQEALDELVLRAQSGHGIAILTGAAGTGKSLLCQKLIAELGGTWTGVVLPNANLPTRKALYQAILFELGQSYQGLDEQELRLALVGWLRANARQARRALLILDEAHLLADRLLEEVRGLADLSEGGKPLVQVVLSGDVALDERLTGAGLNALNQRLACHVVLEPLDQQQSIDYVACRIGWSGGDASQMFAADALPLIARLANGIPRCINHLCDHCLLLTYVNEVEQVSRSIVLDAIADLRQLPLPWNEPFRAGDGTESAGDHAGQAIETGESGGDATPSLKFAIETSEFSGQVTSIEIGGSPNEVVSDIIHEHTAPTVSVANQFDEARDCEDDEFIEEEPAFDENVPHQPAVGYGVVPLVDQPLARPIEPAAQEEGIAFNITRPVKATIGRSSITTPAADSHRESHSAVHQAAGSQFVEERVVDRYAALDAGWSVPPEARVPAPPPTDLGFSDPLDRWNGPSAWSPGIVPLMPEIPHADRVDSAANADQGWSEIARQPDAERKPEAESIEQNSEPAANQHAETHATDSSDDASADYEDIEDQIGNDVLDLCLETQQAILNRFNESEIDGPRSGGNGSDGSAYEAVFGGGSDAESYDVVQPESAPAEGVSDLEALHGDDEIPRRTLRGQVPGRSSDAGLKRLFSTLRKRQK